MLHSGEKMVEGVAGEEVEKEGHSNFTGLHSFVVLNSVLLFG